MFSLCRSGTPSMSVVLGEVVMFHTYKGATELSPTGERGAGWLAG